MNKLFNISEANFDSLGKLSLDYIYALELIANGAVPESSKFNNLAQGLIRKGFVTEKLELTDIGKELYDGLSGEKTQVRVRKIAISKKGLLGIHKKLEDKLLKMTGGKQVKAAIGGKKYNFLCNELDLINRLSRVIAKYKLTDFQAIENTLLLYIERACITKEFFPLVQYYISKTKDSVETSEMVTDMKNEKEAPISRKGKTIDI